MSSDDESYMSDEEEEYQSDSGVEETDEEDSDTELQRAFEKGHLKPGLVKEKVKDDKKHQNNVAGLKQVLSQFRQNLPWIERLDVTCGPAPLAPEIAVELDHYKAMSKRPVNSGRKSEKKSEDDLIRNDFAREMNFYRQGQAAVLEAIPRLHNLGIATQRKEDYFAQMAKTDVQMNRIKKVLQAKQKGMELSERAKKIREIKKYGKKTQISVELQKQKEKREMLNNIKKYKKGQVDNLDFLDDHKKAKKEEKRINLKNKMKDKKYGYGGKKKNSKRNTSKSFIDAASSKKKKALRPGKNRRKQMKNKG